MSTKRVLHGSYRRRIGEPASGGEVTGYWLFAVGLVLGAVGIVSFLASSPNSMLRQTAIVLAASGLGALTIGPVVRLPLRKRATTLSYAGAAVCVTAIGWFVVAYPGSWRLGNPSYFQEIVALYAAGIALIGLGAILVPLLGPVKSEQTVQAERDADSAREQKASAQAEVDTARTEAEAARAEADAATADAEAARAEAGSANADGESARAAVVAVTDRLDAMLESDAWFEVFEDIGGGWRWRLRQTNGEIIAASQEGFDTQEDAEGELQNVARNAGGAPVHEPAEPVDHEEQEADPVDTTPASQASFDIYEDAEGGWRWRLVHDNGNIIADSGEGYASKRNARDGMNRVRGYADESDALETKTATFEIFEDEGEEWRWRLLHDNGNVLADGSEGYHNRSNATRAVDGIRRHATDAGLDS